MIDGLQRIRPGIPIQDNVVDVRQFFSGLGCGQLLRTACLFLIGKLDSPYLVVPDLQGGQQHQHQAG